MIDICFSSPALSRSRGVLYNTLSVPPIDALARFVSRWLAVFLSIFPPLAREFVTHSAVDGSIEPCEWCIGSPGWLERIGSFKMYKPLGFFWVDNHSVWSGFQSFKTSWRCEKLHLLHVIELNSISFPYTNIYTCTKNNKVAWFTNSKKYINCKKEKIKSAWHFKEECLVPKSRLCRTSRYRYECTGIG